MEGESYYPGCRKVRERLRIEYIVGTVATDRQGLEITSTPRWSKTDITARRELVQREVRIVKAVAMKVQGIWTTWEAARQKSVLEGYREYGAA